MVEEKQPERVTPAKPEARRSMGPFDHPWFLPGLLYAFAIWFGYDGWLNENIKSVTFNRVMAPLWLAGALFYTVQNLRDQRRARERGSDAPTTPPPPQ